MSDRPLDRDALRAILDFHVEAGVDIALDEHPHDRFSETAPAPAPAKLQPAQDRPALVARPSGAATALAPEDAALAARERARQAKSLEELHEILAHFEGCALRFSAKNLVFADGNPQSDVMFVGEAPGADEDRIGKPFVGRSGQLLDRMLAAIGLDRTKVYIVNVVPWRPPGNRTPTPQEVAICKPFVARQIELASPKVLVCLGGVAAKNLLGTKEGILRIRGRWSLYRQEDGREIPSLVTLPPDYLLQQPLQKRLGWRDFLSLRDALDGTA